MVFKEVDAPNAYKTSANASTSASTDFSSSSSVSSSSSKIKHRDDLDEEFGLAVRDNEGEAANHGVFFDDTEYDYMQHMRDLGSSDNAYFVEAPAQKQRKGKQVRLEDALESLALSDSAAHSEAGLSTASSPSLANSANTSSSSSTYASSSSASKTSRSLGSISGWNPASASGTSC